MKPLDSLLRKITMYQLMLYFLSAMLVQAAILSITGVLAFPILNLVLSVALLLGVCWVTNAAFARLFRITPNQYSSFITALILALIISPSTTAPAILFMVSAAVLAIASKYLIAPWRKLVFNPAAFGIVIATLMLHQSASWWVGTRSMLPLVILGGVLILRKLGRFILFTTFVVVSLGATILLAITTKQNHVLAIQNVLVDGPLLFFACVMLVEPRTAPPRPLHQVLYGSLVGLLYSGFIHFGQLYFTPEMALIGGNVLSRLLRQVQRS